MKTAENKSVFRAARLIPRPCPGGAMKFKGNQNARLKQT
jgi:hypothetical protein